MMAGDRSRTAPGEGTTTTLANPEIVEEIREHVHSIKRGRGQGA